MATYRVEGPNGEVYEVEGSDDADPSAIFAQLTGGQPQAAPPRDTVAEFNNDPLGQMFASNAQQNQDTRTGIASGVAEGFRRVAGGVKQFLGGAQDMYNLVVKGKPYYNPETRKYEATSQYNKATVEEAARQKLSSLEAQESGINPGIRNLTAGVTSNVALAAGGELAGASRATTLTGNLIRQAAAGGAQAALQGDADRTAGDVLVGAAAPAAFGAFAGAYSALRNTMARGVARATDAGRTAAAVTNAESVLPNFRPSLAQRTGIPELKTLEGAAYNSDLVNFYAKQSDDLVNDVANVLRQPVKEGQDLNTDFVRARQTAQDALTAMQTNRINLWEQGMNEVRSLAPASAQAQVPATNVAAQFAKENADMNNVLRNMGTAKVNARAREALRQLLVTQQAQSATGQQLARLRGATRPGEITVPQLADLLQGMTKLQRESTDPSVRAFATRMRRALDKDVLQLANYQGPALPAVSRLLEVRTEYQRASELERLMKDSVTYKLLGVGQKRNAPIPRSDELVANFSTFAPDRQREFRTWAERNSPDILNTMRQQVVDDAVRNSRTVTEARDSQASLDQLTTALFDPKRGYDVRTSGLWGPADQAKFEGIRDGLRVIANNRNTGGTAGTPIKAEDISINLVSRSMPFLARQATRLLYGRQAARFLTDPKAYEYLTTIRKTGGPTQLAARMALMEYLQDDYGVSPLETQDNGS